MTTNVLDRRNRLLASDSRWSMQPQDPNLLVFMDDTGFDKIADRPFAAMMCAGSMRLIAIWKEWFLGGRGAQMPPSQLNIEGAVHEICVCVVGKKDFSLRFSAGTYENFEDAAEFCGTGAVFAKDCYSVNGCAMTAVKTASRHDPMTGGEVKFVDAKVPFKNNVSNPSTTYEEVQAQLPTKGLIMEKSTGNVYRLDTGEPVHQDLLSAAIAAGLSAPAGQRLRSWTDREREDLQKVMDEILDEEEASNSL